MASGFLSSAQNRPVCHPKTSSPFSEYRSGSPSSPYQEPPHQNQQNNKSMPHGKRAPRLYQLQSQLSTNVTSSGRPAAWPRGCRSGPLHTILFFRNALPLGSPFPSRPRLIRARQFLPAVVPINYLLNKPEALTLHSPSLILSTV